MFLRVHPASISALISVNVFHVSTPVSIAHHRAKQPVHRANSVTCTLLIHIVVRSTRVNRSILIRRLERINRVIHRVPCAKDRSLPIASDAMPSQKSFSKMVIVSMNVQRDSSLIRPKVTLWKRIPACRVQRVARSVSISNNACNVQHRKVTYCKGWIVFRHVIQGMSIIVISDIHSLMTRFSSYLLDTHCEPCQSPCVTCTNRTSCLDCLGDLLLFGSQCVAQCPAGSYANKKLCVQCNQLCATCTGTFTHIQSTERICCLQDHRKRIALVVPTDSFSTRRKRNA